MRTKYAFFNSLLIFICFGQSPAFAHNSYQSSLKLFLTNDKSFIDISLSQYGFEQALKKAQPELNLMLLNEKKIKELLVKHLKTNISIIANGEELQLHGGLLKLGNHQSNVKFKVDRPTESLKSLNVTATCFQANDKQKNYFTLILDNTSARAKLTNENSYQAEFIFK